MIEPARKKRKQLCISEDDIATVLERYSVTTILALLKEVALFGDAKLDWKEIVKNTQTGISNAREYQMLWRHLAYRQTDKIQDGAEPLDDDSDLEYELAAFPPVSHEATAEAAACVKVMMESGLSDSGNPGCSMVEAPLTINIPNGRLSRAPFENSKTPYSMQGKNITVPVSVQKQPLPGGTSTEGLDANGTGGNIPPRRKRKPWTKAEDNELIAAVQKCGEGNWAIISLKGYFKGDRTASQLAQRWAILKKKNGSKNAEGNPSSSGQLSEAQLAARSTMNLFLNPRAKSITSPSSAVGLAGTRLNGATSNSVRTPNTEASSLVEAVHQSEQAATVSNAIPSKAARPNAEASGCVQATHPQQGLNSTANNSVPPPNAEVSGVPAVHQSQQGLAPAKSSPAGVLGLSAKSRVIAKKPSSKSVYNSDSMVKAAAVAAGARIATQSVADSVIKAAKNVHIMPTGGGSLMKSSMSSGATTHLPGHPNVHYICTGLAATQHATHPSVTTSVPRSGPARAAPSTIQRTASVPASSPSMLSKQTNAVPSSQTAEPPSNQQVKTGKEIKVSEMDSAPKEQVQEDRACVAGDAPSRQLEEGKAASSNEAAGSKEETVVDDPSNMMKATESDVGAAVGKKAEENQDANQNSSKAVVSQDANQNNNEAGVSQYPSPKMNNDEKSQGADQKKNKAEGSQDANLRTAVGEKAEGSQDANQKTAVGEKAEGSQDANQKIAVGKKAKGNEDANQNSNKADEVSQDANQNSNKADEVSQYPSQKKNNAEESRDADQKKNKAERSQDANEKNDKAEESQDAHKRKHQDEDQSHNANQNNKAEDQSQAANQNNEMGGSQINGGGGGESAIGNSKNELLLSVEADGASEKPEIVSRAAIGSKI